ncbi:COL21A1, partial [Symbiodinium necroappetens]
DIHDNGTYDDFYKYDSEWKWRRKKVQMVYGHVASGCPTKNEGGDGTPFKSKGKAKPKSAPTTPTAKDDGGQGGSAAARAMVAEPEPQPPAPTSPVNQEGSQQGSQSGEVKDALRDAAQALRSLMSPGSTTASSPASTLEGLQRQLDELRLKTMKVSEDVSVLRMTQRTSLDGRVALEPTEVPTLIDSGATHILRHPRDDGELASATRVSVTLANDEKRDLLQTESGAILSTSKDTQPILPMAELVRAGCEISWKRGVFKVVHPVWGELRTSLRGGCPELAQEQAAKLVNDIEKKKLQEFREGVTLLKSKLEHLVHE